MQIANLDRERLWTAVALCAMAASTMIVEIVLTKFISFKVYHHFVFVIISTVILSFGTAGTCLYLFPKVFLKDGKQLWLSSAHCAALYAVILPVALIFFCWLPLDPYNAAYPVALRAASIGIYFVIFGCSFFFGGVCISQILARSPLSVTSIYGLDLFAAACGAICVPWLLATLGGYGTVAFSAFLGMIAFAALLRASDTASAKKSAIAWSAVFIAVCAGFLWYPGWASQKYGFDIRTAKENELHDLSMADFHGIQSTYWNAIARIDVTKTGESTHRHFFFGIAPERQRSKMAGRLVLVDGGAHTRQFRSDGNLGDKSFFHDVLFASPYIVKPNPRKALVFGGGGGIDILVAKYFKVPQVDVVELNPDTYKHVLRGQDDPEAAVYQPWLNSDNSTTVNVINSEARHYCSTIPPQTYDIIQTSGVDTLTAITSGALASTDNYLYTIDAVRQYMRLLKPDGILSLTHWRQQPPQLSLRMFVTYLTYLEESGVKEPWRHVIVLGTDWVDSMMKSSPYTEEEVERIRQWAKDTGNVVLFDPFHKGESWPGMQKWESIYQSVGFATPEQRKELLNNYFFEVSSTNDDKPYFYYTAKNANAFTSLVHTSAPIIAVLGTFIWAIVLMLAPLFRRENLEKSHALFSSTLFFALCGFAFLLFEVCSIQLFSIFVGGPVYSLSVILVSVLMGYSFGSLRAARLPVGSRSFIAIGVTLFMVLSLCYALLPGTISSLMPLPQPLRIVVCAVITFAISVLCGIPVALGMSLIRATNGSAVGWMWGVSSAFNALAAISFVLITQQTGISITLLLSGLLYLSGCLVFAFKGPWTEINSAKEQSTV